MAPEMRSPGSPLQIAAARANGANSTGPVTPEGKACALTACAFNRCESRFERQYSRSLDRLEKTREKSVFAKRSHLGERDRTSPPEIDPSEMRDIPSAFAFPKAQRAQSCPSCARSSKHKTRRLQRRPSCFAAPFLYYVFLAILNLTVGLKQWAEAHFFIGLSMKREDAILRITAIAEQAAAPAGIEIVEVELKGSGRSHLLRIYIDKPEGVTHADCELISREVSGVLDVEDPIPGTYELEVSSPGLERKLGKWQDWQRFAGKKVKVVLKEPLLEPSLRHFDGVISRAEDHTVTVALAGGKEVTFPVEQVDRANLKFEW